MLPTVTNVKAVFAKKKLTESYESKQKTFPKTSEHYNFPENEDFGEN
jgi:hypothetical protein